MEGGVNGGKTVEEKEVNVLTELLMTQLLKLDAIETHGDSKLQKKTQVLSSLTIYIYIIFWLKFGLIISLRHISTRN